jgi:purine-binding chemotaxis protein CheW
MARISGAQVDVQHLIFVVAGMPCAVPLADVREVLLMAELSPSLSASENIQGLLNLSGEVIPVLKLNRILGLKDWEAGLYSHIILTQFQGRSFGFLSQGVNKILNVPREGLKPIPASESLNGRIQAVIQDGKDLISCLSFASILTQQDEQSQSSVRKNQNSMKEVS